MSRPGISICFFTLMRSIFLLMGSGRDERELVGIWCTIKGPIGCEMFSMVDLRSSIGASVCTLRSRRIGWEDRCLTVSRRTGESPRGSATEGGSEFTTKLTKSTKVEGETSGRWLCVGATRRCEDEWIVGGALLGKPAAALGKVSAVSIIWADMSWTYISQEGRREPALHD